MAEGVRYLHSEGTIHGDLHGVSFWYCTVWMISSPFAYQGNVLLDSELHCKIIDFGSEAATFTQSTNTFAIRYTAPELFGLGPTCRELGCDELHSRYEEHIIKTTKTDVYAFGCLYYSVCITIRLSSDSCGTLSSFRTDIL